MTRSFRLSLPALAGLLVPLLVLALALGASPARAQIVRGQVVEEGSNAPVEGAMLVLLEPGAHVVTRVLTDASGSFIIRITRAGSYLIRVDRIGYESVTTERFEVGAEGTFQRITVPIQPIQLEGIEVGGSRRCELRGEQGAATARAWEEARKALEAAAWTLSSGTYRYTLLGFEREMGPDLRTIRESRRFERGTGQAPYVSFPAAELVQRGFVIQNSDRSLTYRAPDAAAFLSDEFLDTHCMSLGSARDGRIGLAFQPVRGRRTSDIQGTLWIQAATATLERLEFTYTNLPGDIHGTGAGGEVLFGRLPNGTWIVREWSIRMPRVTANPDRTRIVVTGYVAQGGVVWRVTDRDGRTVVESETASVSGTVMDSTGIGPVPGARVRSAEGAAEVVTAADGSFHLSGLPQGLVTLEVGHASLDTLGLGPVRAQVEAMAGAVTTRSVRLPGAAELLGEACAGSRPADRETAVVLGRVLRGARPAQGERVRVRWLAGLGQQAVDFTARAAPPLAGSEGPKWREDPQDQRWIETNLDGRGVFMVCAVPTGSQLRVEAGEGMAIQALTVTVTSGKPFVFVPLTLGDTPRP